MLSISVGSRLAHFVSDAPNYITSIHTHILAYIIHMLNIVRCREFHSLRIRHTIGLMKIESYQS